MVPRPGEGDDDDRQRQLAREVAHQVVGGEGDEEAADALADEQLGALGRGPGGRAQPLRVDRLARQLGRQVRGDGGP